MLNNKHVLFVLLFQLVMERKELLLKQGNNNLTENDDDNPKPKILVDQLLTTTNEDGKPYTNKQITDNIYAVMTGVEILI